MTLQETRQLGIEFERRIQTMIPSAEIGDKLDTDTIYSFLNQYQDKYVHEIYRSLDSIPSGSKLSSHIESILLSMLTSCSIANEQNLNYKTNVVFDNNSVLIVDTARSYTYKLPTDFYMYIRSVSEVSSTYAWRGDDKTKILPNKIVSQSDIWKLVETPHDSLRILRYPAAVLNQYNNNEPTITVVFDSYTTVKGIRVLYYKQPQHFSIITSTPCELPMDAFDDIVTGAVDLYVQYVAGAEAKKRQMQEQAEKRAREDQRDARRSGGNQDEQQ